MSVALGNLRDAEIIKPDLKWEFIISLFVKTVRDKGVVVWLLYIIFLIIKSRKEE